MVTRDFMQTSVCYSGRSLTYRDLNQASPLKRLSVLSTSSGYKPCNCQFPNFVLIRNFPKTLCKPRWYKNASAVVVLNFWRWRAHTLLMWSSSESFVLVSETWHSFFPVFPYEDVFSAPYLTVSKLTSCTKTFHSFLVCLHAWNWRFRKFSSEIMTLLVAHIFSSCIIHNSVERLGTNHRDLTSSLISSGRCYCSLDLVYRICMATGSD